MKKKKCDIFISYRRAGGSDAAQLIYNELLKRKYRVFLDLHELTPGKFNPQLYRNIEKCKVVLLICSPDCLERCINPDDWVTKELSHAILKKKLIIPVFLDGFTFPDKTTLPKQLQELEEYQGLPLNLRKDSFDAAIDKLCNKYLPVKPITASRKIAISLSILLLLGGTGGTIYKMKMDQIAIEQEKEHSIQVSSADQYCAAALGYLDMNTQAGFLYIEKCREYLAGEIDQREFKKYAQKQKETILNIPLIEYPKVEDTFEGAFFCEEMTRLSDSSLDYAKQIDLLEWLILESSKKDSMKQNVLDLMEDMWSQTYIEALDDTYGVFLQVKDIFQKKESGKYKYSTIAYIYNISGQSLCGKYVKESLFGNSNSTISREELDGVISSIDDNIQNTIQKIKTIVGHKWDEFLTGEK